MDDEKIIGPRYLEELRKYSASGSMKKEKAKFCPKCGRTLKELA